MIDTSTSIGNIATLRNPPTLLNYEQDKLYSPTVDACTWK